MTDGAGTETYAYDARNRLTNVTRGPDLFSYAYDPVGNLLSRTDPDGTVTSYSYDDDGRMASATSGGLTTTYRYDPAGNRLTAATPDGFVARSAYDRAGRLLEIAHVGAGRGPVALHLCPRSGRQPTDDDDDPGDDALQL